MQSKGILNVKVSGSQQLEQVTLRQVGLHLAGTKLLEVTLEEQHEHHVVEHPGSARANVTSWGVSAIE